MITTKRNWTLWPQHEGCTYICDNCMKANHHCDHCIMTLLWPLHKENIFRSTAWRTYICKWRDIHGRRAMCVLTAQGPCLWPRDCFTVTNVCHTWTALAAAVPVGAELVLLMATWLQLYKQVSLLRCSNKLLAFCRTEVQGSSDQWLSVETDRCVITVRQSGWMTHRYVPFPCLLLSLLKYHTHCFQKINIYWI